MKSPILSIDTFFMAMCFVSASHLKHLNLNFYQIYGSQGSASKSWDYKRIKDLLSIFDILEE